MKIASLLGAILLLTGCASEPPPAPPSTPARTASDFDFAKRPVHQAPYIVGTSTEDELIAKRGAPVTRAVDNDGTRSDTYPALMTYIDFSGDKPREVMKPRATTSGSKINVIYIYSADGILRRIMSDIVSIGADGQEHHQVADVNDAS